MLRTFFKAYFFTFLVWGMCLQTAIAQTPAGTSASATSSCQEPCAALSWMAPTHNTDGTPYTNPGGYKIYWGATQGTYPNEVTLNDPSLTTYQLTSTNGLMWGTTYYFVITAFNTNGAESAQSNAASKVIPAQPPAPPNPPSSLTVAANTQTAYTFQITTDHLALVPVATVASGTQCNTQVYIKDSNGILAYDVPVASVITWLGSSRPNAIFATCS